MKTSIRRIGNALLTFSVLSLCLGFVSSITIECATNNAGCLTSALTFSNNPTFATNFTVAESTSAYGVLEASTDWGSVIQIVSMYALLVAVGILVLLECLELYYIRSFLKIKNFRLR